MTSINAIPYKRLSNMDELSNFTGSYILWENYRFCPVRDNLWVEYRSPKRPRAVRYGMSQYRFMLVEFLKIISLIPSNLNIWIPKR